MKMKNILSFLLVNYENDDRVSEKILKEMQEAVLEMEAAESMFNAVSDPKLIEVAIYKEQSAKRKFDYLLSMAKEQYERDKMEI